MVWTWSRGSFHFIESFYIVNLAFFVKILANELMYFMKKNNRFLYGV